MRPVNELHEQLPPLEPLCSLQSEMGSIYAEILSTLQIKYLDAKGDRATAVQIVLDRLRHDASWAATEVRSSRAYKLIRQRYISGEVAALWVNARRSKNGKFILEDLCRDGNKKSLSHEHVFQAQNIKHSLNSLSSEDEIRKVLQSSLACVVTSAEHKILGDDDRRTKKDGLFEDGWRRYIRSKIEVYDRLEQRWIVRIS